MNIQYARGGMPVITVKRREHLSDAVGVGRQMPDRQFHRAELYLDLEDRILETSDYKYWTIVQGHNTRDFRISDVWWNQLRVLRDEFAIIVRQGTWYFLISRFDPAGEWDGMGSWYSRNMIRTGWGPNVQL